MELLGVYSECVPVKYLKLQHLIHTAKWNRKFRLNNSLCWRFTRTAAIVSPHVRVLQRYDLSRWFSNDSLRRTPGHIRGSFLPELLEYVCSSKADAVCMFIQWGVQWCVSGRCWNGCNRTSTRCRIKHVPALTSSFGSCQDGSGVLLAKVREAITHTHTHAYTRACLQAYGPQEYIYIYIYHSESWPRVLFISMLKSFYPPIFIY